MQTNQQTEVIAELWGRMAEIYGHRWLSSYGPTDANGTWAVGLAGLSPEQVGIGVTTCIHSGEDWPPSLPRFRNMCLGIPPLDAVVARLSGGGRGLSAFEHRLSESMDPWRRLQASEKELKAMIKRAYVAQRDRIVNQALQLTASEAAT